MRTNAKWLAAVVIVLAGSAQAWASSPCGIYARIEDVSVEYDAGHPVRAIIKGDFLFFLTSRRLYGPNRGYLCLSLEKAEFDSSGAYKGRVSLTGKAKERCLIEWDDLKNLVDEKGKGKAYVAFGSAQSEAFQFSPDAWETPEKARKNAFPHPLHHGLTRLRVPDAGEARVNDNDEDRNPVILLQKFQTKNAGEPK